MDKKDLDKSRERSREREKKDEKERKEGKQANRYLNSYDKQKQVWGEVGTGAENIQCFGQTVLVE